MYLNNRSAPPELLHYRALMKRRVLSKQEHLKMRMAERGYEGECLYDEIFEDVRNAAYEIITRKCIRISRCLS